MLRAKSQLNCSVFGIDPSPGEQGVGRYEAKDMEAITIDKGFAENLPYDDNHFDVVFCSHVLEHVDNEDVSLQELMKNTNSQEMFLKSRYIPKNQDQDNSIDKQSQESWLKKYWWMIFGFILLLGYFIANNYVKK